MKGYRIVWKSTRYGTSFVKANSPEEARMLAFNGKDEAFEPNEPDDDWDIDSVEEFELD